MKNLKGCSQIIEKDFVFVLKNEIKELLENSPYAQINRGYANFKNQKIFFFFFDVISSNIDIKNTGKSQRSRGKRSFFTKYFRMFIL